MKKLIVSLVLMVSFPSFAEIKIHHSEKGIFKFETGTLCIGGYLHSYIISRDGAALVQLRIHGKWTSDPNPPIACKEQP